MDVETTPTTTAFTTSSFTPVWYSSPRHQTLVRKPRRRIYHHTRACKTPENVQAIAALALEQAASRTPPTSPVSSTDSIATTTTTTTTPSVSNGVVKPKPLISNGVVNDMLRVPAMRRRHTQIPWNSIPRSILLAVSPHSKRALRALPIVARHLSIEYNATVLVEDIVQNSASGYATCVSKNTQGAVNDDVDVIICLGGDGLILHVVSTLFPEVVPPILPFNLGSLGFLAVFEFQHHVRHISNIFTGPGDLRNVSVRMRLKCQVIRSNNDGCMLNFKADQMVEDCSPGAVADAEFHVLNELVIDRGPAPYLSNLVVSCDGVPITRVQADGLILATPTGSTAYNLSAGGSMVHPDVPAILFTPICPHSLSFRPVLFPEYVTLTIKVPEDSRATAWVCFDGRSRMELLRGDQVVVQMSEWTVPTFCKNDATQDWFRSVSKCLRWNERLTQGAGEAVRVDEDDYEGSDV